MIIGAHIPKDKTILSTIQKIYENNGNALQLFASNPRSGKIGDIEKYKNEAKEIKEYCNKNDFHLVIHSSYTINLAKEFKNDKREIEMKDCYWINLLLYELEVADILNAIGCVVHVGKYTTQNKEDALENMKKAIKYIIKNKKGNAKLILETAAGQGTELLTDLNDFVEFYNSFTKTEKEEMGICLDTCHVWSAGYELEEALTILKNNQKDLCVVHLNNSKKDKNSHTDKHEYLLEGKIELNKIKKFLSHKIIKNTIIILEMPTDELNKEISWVKLE